MNAADLAVITGHNVTFIPRERSTTAICTCRWQGTYGFEGAIAEFRRHYADVIAEAAEEAAAR